MNAETQNLFERADRLFERGDYAACTPLFERIVADHPDGYADAWGRLGLIHHGEGRVEEAVACYEKAIQVNPDYTEAALNLVVALNDLGRFEDAEQLFRDAAERLKDGEEGAALAALANRHVRLGDDYVRLERLDDAMHEYRRALTLRPTYVDVICKLGTALRKVGRTDDALRVLGRAKELNPAFASPYVQAGLIYYKKGFLDVAMTEWQTALDLDPARRDAEAFLATVRRALLQQ
jgi:tetratricopeptide (TPR) repeat protein